MRDRESRGGDLLTAPAEQMTSMNNCGTEPTEQQAQEQLQVELPEPRGLGTPLETSNLQISING